MLLSKPALSQKNQIGYISQDTFEYTDWNNMQCILNSPSANPQLFDQWVAFYYLNLKYPLINLYKFQLYLGKTSALSIF